MSFIIGILTFFLIINCLLLILLVLVQLPKKDAGAGLAFGGGAADALFGAGSGNALTKITKWATVVFLALAVILGYAQSKTHRGSNAAEFERQVEQQQMQQSPAAAPSSIAPAIPQPSPLTTNTLLSAPLGITNAPAK